MGSKASQKNQTAIPEKQLTLQIYPASQPIENGIKLQALDQHLSTTQAL